MRMARNKPLELAPILQEVASMDSNSNASAPPPPNPPDPILDTTIRCPICFRPFRTLEQIDLHIDSCTGPAASSSPYNLRPVQPPALQRPVHHMTSLPKVNYALHNEKQLRSMLGKLGLPTYGNKALLTARHKEYVTLHNANMDRQNPESRHELLKQMEKWEAVHQGLPKPEKRKLDVNEWEKKRKNDFDELTKRALESAKRRKLVDKDINGEGSSIGRSSQEETVA